MKSAGGAGRAALLAFVASDRTPETADARAALDAWVAAVRPSRDSLVVGVAPFDAALGPDTPYELPPEDFPGPAHGFVVRVRDAAPNRRPSFDRRYALFRNALRREGGRRLHLADDQATQDALLAESFGELFDDPPAHDE